MSEACQRARAVLARWDPEEDLERPVAVHVGVCPACRARFERGSRALDGLRVDLRAQRAPPRRRRWPVELLALAAGVAVAAGIAGWVRAEAQVAVVEHDELMPLTCPAEFVVVAAMECPPA
ncbi:MAG: hypothetical protein R3F59_08735 [Myxococcota bacterium]